MTRQEEHILDREELKQEIKAEIKREGRRHRLFVAAVALLVMLGIIIVPFLVVTVLVARTGLWTVPVLTEWVYEPVTPTRIVTPLSGSNIENILGAVIARSNYNPNFGYLTLYLTEKELTTVLNSLVAEGDKNALPFSIDSLQAVLENDKVEIYALTSRADGSKVPILAGFVPQVKAGQLSIASTDLTIGTLDIPDFLTGAMANTAAGQLTKAVNAGLSDIGYLEKINVTPERIEFLVRPKK
jgi:hypothetical protein